MNPRIGRAFAGAAVLVLTLTGSLHLLDREPPAASSATPPEAVPAAPSVSEGPLIPAPLSAEEVSTLFGFRAQPPPGTAEPQEREVGRLLPLTRTPLRYVGWAAGSEDGRSFLFADGTTGRILRLSRGHSSRGWALVEESEDRFVLSDGSVRFVVEKR